MSLNSTPSADRVHIGFFGKRNAGKSSLINAVTNQQVSIVSDVEGTTTDPVYKAMELLPLGPVMIIDTPGIDDEGELGQLRVERTKKVLNKTDIAVLVADANHPLGEYEKELISAFEEKNISYIIAYNKTDLFSEVKKDTQNEIYVSAQTGYGIDNLKQRLAAFSKTEQKHIVADLISPEDLVVLVVPIDSSAPKGRLILPQQQTIRDILDIGAMVVVCRETELKQTLDGLCRKPAMVITDSQVFDVVDKIVPDDIHLTSFSILLARYKGLLNSAVKGVAAIESLKDGDKILIAEGCTHHRQCEDIGTVKIPNWLKKHTGKNIVIETASGVDFPQDLSIYSLIIHCGGCMLNEREVRYRVKCAEDSNVPITNYGISIAYMKGILKRSIAIFPDLYKLI